MLGAPAVHMPHAQQMAVASTNDHVPRAPKVHTWHSIQVIQAFESRLELCSHSSTAIPGAALHLTEVPHYHYCHSKCVVRGTTTSYSSTCRSSGSSSSANSEVIHNALRVILNTATLSVGKSSVRGGGEGGGASSHGSNTWHRGSMHHT